MRRGSLALAVLATLCAVPGFAQDAPGFRPRQITVSVGGALASGYPIGDLTVTIPRNPSVGSTPFTLLRAESELERAFGFDARVAFALTRDVAIEVGGTYASPDVVVSISQDAELPGGAIASERVQQYGVDVSALYHLPFAASRRARTYFIGGAGYLRQLHEGRLLVETGQTIHIGGGVQYWLRGVAAARPLRPRGRSLGLRAEARYVSRFGGVDFEDGTRRFPAASALLFVAF